MRYVMNIHYLFICLCSSTSCVYYFFPKKLQFYFWKIKQTIIFITNKYWIFVRLLVFQKSSKKSY